MNKGGVCVMIIRHKIYALFTLDIVVLLWHIDIYTLLPDNKNVGGDNKNKKSRYE